MSATFKSRHADVKGTQEIEHKSSIFYCILANVQQFSSSKQNRNKNKNKRDVDSLLLLFRVGTYIKRYQRNTKNQSNISDGK